MLPASSVAAAIGQPSRYFEEIAGAGDEALAVVSQIIVAAGENYVQSCQNGTHSAHFEPISATARTTV